MPVDWKLPRSCPECSHHFTPSYKPQKHCSRTCSAKERAAKMTTSITVQCHRCGVPFDKRPSQLTKQGKEYCSVVCRKEPLEKTCEGCGELYQAHIINHKTRRFCSKSCAKSGENHHFYGKEGPNKGFTPWTKGLTKDTDPRIAALGELVSATQKQQFTTGIRDNKGENNPNHNATRINKIRSPEQLDNYSRASINKLIGDQPLKKFRFKQGNHFSKKADDTFHYRSSYELRYMLCLDRDDHVIHWEHEPFSIKIETGKRYLPDFLVKTSDGKTFLLEVKPVCFATNEQVVLKAKAGQKYAQARGWEYKMITLDDIVIYETQLETETNNDQ